MYVLQWCVTSFTVCVDINALVTDLITCWIGLLRYLRVIETFGGIDCTQCVDNWLSLQFYWESSLRYHWTIIISLYIIVTSVTADVCGVLQVLDSVLAVGSCLCTRSAHCYRQQSLWLQSLGTCHVPPVKCPSVLTCLTAWHSPEWH